MPEPNDLPMNSPMELDDEARKKVGGLSQELAAPRQQGRFTPEAIADIFTYHAPTPDQLPKYEAIRSAARQFAEVLVANTPASADQTAAIRLLREAVMTANAAIATGGKY